MKLQIKYLLKFWRHEWNGAWSDNSDELKSLSTAERSKVCKLLSENDGEFLVSIDDFIKVRKVIIFFFRSWIVFLPQNFENFETCNLAPGKFGIRNITNDKSDDFITGFTWHVEEFHGSWKIESNNAGGQKNPSKNPQFVINLQNSEYDKDDQSTCIVALMQKQYRQISISGICPKIGEKK